MKLYPAYLAVVAVGCLVTAALVERNSAGQGWWITAALISLTGAIMWQVCKR